MSTKSSVKPEGPPCIIIILLTFLFTSVSLSPWGTNMPEVLQRCGGEDEERPSSLLLLRLAAGGEFGGVEESLFTEENILRAILFSFLERN